MKTVKLICAGVAALSAAQVMAVPGAERRAEARAKAAALVRQLTGDECVSELMMESKPVDRLGVPAYHWWNEALHGVARAGLATMFPQAIGAAATFDAELEQAPSKWKPIEGSCIVPANGYKIVWFDGDGLNADWAPDEAHVAANISTDAERRVPQDSHD